MLTDAGRTLLLQIATGASDDVIATLAVSDGERSAQAPAVATVQDGTAILHAEFASQEANFEWRTREVRSAQGVVIDREDEDGGRKAPGSVWSLEVQLELR